MPILLLANQVRLVEGVGLHFDRFYAAETDAQLGEFFDLVRVVGQKDELWVDFQDLEDVLDVGVLAVVVGHAQGFVGLKCVDVLVLLVVLHIHTRPTFPHIPTPPTLLNQIKQDPIPRTDLFNGTIQLLPTITIQTPHKFRCHTTAV